MDLHPAAFPATPPSGPRRGSRSPRPAKRRQSGPHLELRLGDLAAAVQVERGEGVPDGFEQLVLQAPHGCGRAAPTDLTRPVGPSAPLPPAGAPQTTLPAVRSPDRGRPRPFVPAPCRPRPSVPPAVLQDVGPCPHRTLSLCGFVNTTPGPSGGFPHQLRPFSELAYAWKEMSPIPGNTRDWSDQSLRPLWESHSYYRSFGSVLRWSHGLKRSDKTAEKMPRASVE